jgi:hypothetical protein
MASDLIDLLLHRTRYLHHNLSLLLVDFLQSTRELGEACCSSENQSGSLQFMPGGDCRIISVTSLHHRPARWRPCKRVTGCCRLMSILPYSLTNPVELSLLY